MSNLRETKRFWRNRLPHWEVRDATFFVTIRCKGSIPHEGRIRLRELSDNISKIESNSEHHTQLQRTIFATCEKYLDCGYGFSPFTDCSIALDFISTMKNWTAEARWLLASYCVMPNHIHLLASKQDEKSVDLKTYVSRLKGTSARSANLLLNRTGSLWQSDWFDRWIRNEAEYERTINYILDNPVKAGLVTKREEYEFSSANK